jgi:hypothetical protein
MKKHDSYSFRNGAMCAFKFVKGMRGDDVFKTDPKMGIQALFEVLDELTEDDFDEFSRG